MFTQLRQERAALVDAAQNALTAAQQNLQPLRDQVAARQIELTNAQSNLAQAAATAQSTAAARDSAQIVVNQRQGIRDTAAAALTAATRDRDEILDGEPVSPLPNGHPNPDLPAWKAKLAKANEHLAAAQNALNHANAALTQAAQARDTAQAQANSAEAARAATQARVQDAATALAVAANALTTSTGSLDGLQQAVDQARSALEALDARAARLVAQPLDRTDLEAATEEEVAELTARRLHRHDLVAHRSDFTNQRTALLAAEDNDVAALVLLRNDIAGWSEAGRFASLGTARAALDAVIAATQTQQGQSAPQRTDDLGAAQNAVAQAVANVQSALNQAGAERDQQNAALTAAAQALADHQREQP